MVCRIVARDNKALPRRARMNLLNVLGTLLRPHRVTLGVRVLVIDANGAVLLVRHTYTPGWHLPGGRVDTGESLAAAAAREVREETGLTLSGAPELIAVYARLRWRTSDHVALLRAGGWTGAPAANGWEIRETAFFPLSRLPEGVTPATGRRLEELSAGSAPAEHW